MLCTLSRGDDFGTCLVFERIHNSPITKSVVSDIFVETSPIIIIIICFRIKELELNSAERKVFEQEQTVFRWGPLRDAHSRPIWEARFHLSYDFNQNRKTHIFSTHTHSWTNELRVCVSISHTWKAMAKNKTI